MSGKSEAEPDWAACADARRLATCRFLGTVVSEDLADILGPLVVDDGWPARFDGELRWATIPVTLIDRRFAVWIGVVMSPDDLGVLGATLLATEAPADSALDDVLRELANTAGGAVKRAACGESVLATMGLPRTAELELPPDEGFTRRWSLVARATGHTLGIVEHLVRLAPLAVPATRLEEGMVVAADVRGEDGALLAAAGTRLTAYGAARVARMLGEQPVEVSPAA